MRSLPLIPEAVDLLTEATETGRFSIAPDDPREKWEAADLLLKTYIAQEDMPTRTHEEPSSSSSHAKVFKLTPFGMSEAETLTSLFCRELDLPA
jgi:hypothetical protein